jgi:hypothetical protein
MQIMKAYRNMMARVGGVLLLAGAVLFVGGATTAEAAFVAAVCDDAACDGAGDVFVADNSGSDTVGGAVGVGIINFTALGVAGWEVTISTSQTKPALGSAAEPVINLSYGLNNLAGAAAPIWLYAGDTGYTGQGNVHLVVNATTTGQTTTGLALGGDDNLVDLPSGLNLAPVLISLGPFADVFSASATNGPVGAAPYALTAGVMIVDTGGLTGTSGDVTVSVPEPATIALFGLGLFGVGVMSRRRRQAQAQ